MWRSSTSPGCSTSRVSTCDDRLGLGQAAHAWPLERRVEAQPEHVAGRGARDLDPRLDSTPAHAVVLAAKPDGRNEHLGVHARPAPGGDVQGLQIEEVSSLRHRDRRLVRRAVESPQRQKYDEREHTRQGEQGRPGVGPGHFADESLTHALYHQGDGVVLRDFI